MKKIEKGTIKSLIANTIGFIVAAMIIWPLLDWLIFERAKFSYTAYKYIIVPIIFGVVISTIFWLFERRQVKKGQNNNTEENK